MMGELSGNVMPSQMQSIAMRVTAQMMRVTAQARHCMAAAIMAGIRACARTHAMAKSVSAIPTATFGASGATASATTASATTASAASAMREDRVS
jgi:hypothetical protein